MDRYEAIFGFNSKQWWIYDNDNDTYIDPPICVLKEIEKIDDIDEQAIALEDATLDGKADWLFDEEYIYDAEDTDI